MKNKLRKLMINEVSYYYRFTEKYLGQHNYDWTCISKFKAFYENKKNTPLVISIEVIADYIIGNPLKIGTDGVNLNCPKWAKNLILYGITNGWNGQRSVDLNCSYETIIKMKDNP